MVGTIEYMKNLDVELDNRQNFLQTLVTWKKFYCSFWVSLNEDQTHLNMLQPAELIMHNQVFGSTSTDIISK